jgi:hypothetical protein
MSGPPGVCGGGRRGLGLRLGQLLLALLGLGQLLQRPRGALAAAAAAAAGLSASLPSTPPPSHPPTHTTPARPPPAPAGIGKTSCAHIIAAELGYALVEVNASDTRSKSDAKPKDGIAGKMSNVVREMATNRALAGPGGRARKPLLVMDEVDGMSGGWRGWCGGAGGWWVGVEEVWWGVGRGWRRCVGAWGEGGGGVGVWGWWWTRQPRCTAPRQRSASPSTDARPRATPAPAPARPAQAATAAASRT